MSWFQDMLDKFNRWWDGKEEEKPVPPHKVQYKADDSGHVDWHKNDWADRVKRRQPELREL